MKKLILFTLVFSASLVHARTQPPSNGSGRFGIEMESKKKKPVVPTLPPQLPSPTDLPKIVQIPVTSPYTFPRNPTNGGGNITDSNSPVVWNNETNKMIMFNSAGVPWRSEGFDIHQMSVPEVATYNNDIGGGRWIEAVVEQDGTLYGYYHYEPYPFICGGLKTAPKIGAAKSLDKGRTWTDLGIILEGEDIGRCDTPNAYFNGGHGDFSVMLDKSKTYLYFFFSNYQEDGDEQGVSAAVMAWADRDKPATWDDRHRNWDSRVQKYFSSHPDEESGAFSQAGDRGFATPLNPEFHGKKSWHLPDPDVYWGPSVHWNSYLNLYVMFLNHATSSDATWHQEGIYVSFSPSLEDPSQWTKPYKVVDQSGLWYPQIIGIDANGHYSDKEAGCSATFYQSGQAISTMYFLYPGQTQSPCLKP